jgi:hypothetical protein
MYTVQVRSRKSGDKSPHSKNSGMLLVQMQKNTPRCLARRILVSGFTEHPSFVVLWIVGFALVVQLDG